MAASSRGKSRCQALVGLEVKAIGFQWSVLKKSPIDVLPPFANGVS